jgi:uncharacterized membrane protein YphA (DoxX/SURF4 family)
VYSTVPLRLFLGLTFVYAGLQKIADPGFLQPGSATYIGTQLESFATHSPIGFLLDWLALPVPQLAGIGVIVTELVIGALVILGLATRWAAAAGALLSFVLFLTASWTVQPYFLGSDSIYTVAWITLALIGDQGVLTARPLFFTDRPAGGVRTPAVTDLARRRLLIQIGGAGVALVWGSIHSGSAQNVIPSTGVISGTLRMLDAQVWDEIGPLLHEAVRAVISPYDVTAKVDHVRGVPPVVNDLSSVEMLRDATVAAFGHDAAQTTLQSLGGEDFAWYLQAVPGALARLGTRTPGGETYDLHQGDLVVDERAVAIGARLLAAAALAHPAS